MSPSPTEPLEVRAGRGDRGALAEIFAAAEPKLVRMIGMRLDAALRRRLDPTDVVQEAWIEVGRRFPEWLTNPVVPLHVWIRLVTSQALATAQRRHLSAHMRDAMREVPAFESRVSISSANAADLFVASATSPTRAVQREEVRSLVVAALEDLDELDREIVALRHFEGLSNEETAAELAIAPAAASKRFVRALIRLKPVLQKLANPGDPRAG
jgi:RNA polymerase sigma-70 factor (ECF subfamily)